MSANPAQPDGEVDEQSALRERLIALVRRAWSGEASKAEIDTILAELNTLLPTAPWTGIVLWSPGYPRDPVESVDVAMWQAHLLSHSSRHSGVRVTVAPEIEVCFQSGRDAATLLYALAVRMKTEGRTQAETYSFFEDSRAALREQDREADEDMVMDVMDCIYGWCRQEYRIFPEDH